MKKILLGLLVLGTITANAVEALKVGDKAIHTGTIGNVKVKIIAINQNGTYVAKYKSLIDGNTTYGNASRYELALMSGCSEDLCVGDKAIHTGTIGNVEVKIIAIRADGNYVAKYISLLNGNRTYGNVSRSQLGKM